MSDGYRTLLTLSSHEYFHLWNVKRIAARFTLFDLTQESPTTLLWAFEGITAYYEPSPWCGAASSIGRAGSS